MPNTNLLVILPFLITVITGMVVLLVDALWLNGKSKRPVVGISLAGILGAIWSISFLKGQGIEGFNGTVVSDGFSLLFQFVTLMVTALAILLSEKYVQQKGINFGEYYALMLFSASGALIMASARELILIFIGLEILSIALYVLSGIARTEEKSEEAAVKYFLLGAFSSGFFLYGIALFYGGTGSTLLTNVSTLLATNSSHGTFSLYSPYTVAGIAFLLVGLCFKAGIVPFHSWTPDVYQGAPTSVTAFMSAAAKAGAFAALIRIVSVILPISSVWQDVLWMLAALTMIVGNVVALWQQDLKRMLAYSSIAHAGYILCGVLAANADGRAAVLYYMLVYSFMNIGAFGVIILLTRTGYDRSRIIDFQGLGKRDPLAATLMSIFLFSLAGVPPAAGFLGKFYLLQAVVEAHLTGLAVVLVLSSVVGAYYYLSVIWRMWFVPAVDETEQPALSWGLAPSSAIWVSAIMTILLFFCSGPIISSFTDATDVLDNGSSTSTIATSSASHAPVAVSALPPSGQ
jgi:NADH-quinone oxidoreductase subunit N